jgi:hypothetical protein
MPETRALSQTTGDWIVSPQVDFVAPRSYVRLLEHVFLLLLKAVFTDTTVLQLRQFR